MAAYDQGGGCACGLSRVCDCAHAKPEDHKQSHLLALKRLLWLANHDAKIALENLRVAKQNYREALNADTST